MTNEQLDEAEAILIDLVSVGATLYPPLAIAAPIVKDIIKLNFSHVKVGLATGMIIAPPNGGLVSKAWADDPRHALNADGSFKDKSW